MRSWVAPLALVALLTACAPGATGDPADPNDPTNPTGPTDPTDPTQAAPPGRTTCDEVVAGIDDFNLGDFDGTVRHFELAVPLAEAAVRDDPSRRARDLLEAVRYYADLAPEDYPAASLGSADFEKYKQITLGQCVADGPPPTDGGDGGGVLA